MFSGRGQEPLTSPRAPQDTAGAKGPPPPRLPAKAAFLGGCQARGGRTDAQTPAYTRTRPLPTSRPRPSHLSTISLDPEAISSLEGEKGGVLLAVGGRAGPKEGRAGAGGTALEA